MPMPKALVATITGARSRTKASWFASRSSSSSPAWYRTAPTPWPRRKAHTSSTALRVAQYTMPERLPRGPRKSRRKAFLSRGRSTRKERLGRSKPVESTRGSRSPRRRTMSSRTSGVAVAVKAPRGGRWESRAKASGMRR